MHLNAPAELAAELERTVPFERAEQIVRAFYAEFGEQALVRVVRDVKSEVALLAVTPVLGEALQRSARARTVITALCSLLDRERPLSVRIAAIDALSNARTDNSDVHSLLRRLANDGAENPAVVAAAKEALEAIA